MPKPATSKDANVLRTLRHSYDRVAASMPGDANAVDYCTRQAGRAVAMHQAVQALQVRHRMRYDSSTIRSRFYDLLAIGRNQIDDICIAMHGVVAASGRQDEAAVLLPNSQQVGRHFGRLPSRGRMHAGPLVDLDDFTPPITDFAALDAMKHNPLLWFEINSQDEIQLTEPAAHLMEASFAANAGCLLTAAFVRIEGQNVNMYDAIWDMCVRDFVDIRIAPDGSLT